MTGWRIERMQGVARLSIDRPQTRGAISLAMWAQLPGLLQEIIHDGHTRALLLRGTGGTFSSGADIEEFHTAFATEAAALHNLAVMQAAMAAMAAFPVPSVAALEGPAMGAALALATCCDLRIAAADALLAITPAKLGLLFAHGDVARLEALIGPAKAKLLLFTGRVIDAPTALAWGLIDEIAAPSLDPAVQRLLDAVLAGAANTQIGQKRMFELLAGGQRTESDETRALFAKAFQGRDFQEGYQAFKAKRAPRFPSNTAPDG